MKIREGLTFDDVLLVPRHSKINSRSNVDTSIVLPKGFKFSHPIIPANMKTVTGFEMAKAVADSGGLAILHRFMPLEEQLDIANKFVLMSQDGPVDYVRHVSYSIGVKKEDYEAVKAFAQVGCAKILCVDIAHGDSDMCLKMCEFISKEYPEVLLIAGNVATAAGARNLWDAGADVVKVGIGPGSLCTTRVETGNGVPQLTALMDIWESKLWSTTKHDLLKEMWPDIELKNKIKKPVAVIADGGIKNAGDCVKALCFADMVMAGNAFAGAVESPGMSIQIDGKFYKEYVGSSTHKTNHVEGVAAIVPTKGRFQDILTRMMEGIKSGCSYQGCNNLNELKENPEFVKITNAGLKESHPHDVVVK